MAIIASNEKLEFKTLNFAADTGLPNFEFRDDANGILPTGGIFGLPHFIPFNDAIFFYEGPSVEDFTSGLAVIGTGYEFDGIPTSFTDPLAGTATGFLMLENPITPALANYFAMLEVSVSLVDLYNVGLTASIADDQALLRQMLAGDDQVIGSEFGDQISTYNGADYVLGGGGRDTISGGKGNDTIYGDNGDDVLKGDAGNDLILGGKGADTITGGRGSDQLFGGVDTNVDVFVFQSVNDSKADSARDKIYEFEAGIDKIRLSGIDADVGAPGNQVFAYGDETPVAHGVWTSVQSGNLTVWADVTGDAIADFSVRLMGVIGVSETDFFL